MIHVNKERLGDFIGSERKNLGLTQRDLAARLHGDGQGRQQVGAGTELPGCDAAGAPGGSPGPDGGGADGRRRQAAKERRRPMQSLLDISRDSVRQERRRSWQRLAAVLVLLAVTAAVVAYTQIVVTEEGYYSIVLKETVNGRNCVYVEDRGHLIRLKCGEDVDFDALTLRDERGDTISYQMDFQEPADRTGTVSACETPASPFWEVSWMSPMRGIPAACRFSSAIASVQYLRDGYYPDPLRRVRKSGVFM